MKFHIKMDASLTCTRQIAEMTDTGLASPQDLLLIGTVTETGAMFASRY